MIGYGSQLGNVVHMPKKGRDVESFLEADPVSCHTTYLRYM